MKSFLSIVAVATLLVASVAAQSGHSVVESLAVRGHLLLEKFGHEIDELKRLGHSHLVESLVEQVTVVEAFVKELDALHKDQTKQIEIHHLHAIEESLMKHENRLAEELEAVKKVVNGSPAGPKKPEELVQHAEALLKKAKDAVKAHEGKKHNQDIVEAIESEIKKVEKLEAQVKHPDHKDDVKEVEALARHEHTLHQLIDRLELGHKN